MGSREEYEMIGQGSGVAKGRSQAEERGDAESGAFFAGEGDDVQESGRDSSIRMYSHIRSPSSGSAMLPEESEIHRKSAGVTIRNYRGRRYRSEGARQGLSPFQEKEREEVEYKR